MGSFRRVLVGVYAVVVAGGLLGIPTENASAAAAQPCNAAGYKLSLQSLTGPPRADLIIRISAKKAGCELPATLTGVQVTLLPYKKLRARKLIRSNVPAPGGTATVNIGRVPRLRLLRAVVSFGPQVMLIAQTKTLLRPDLVLTRAYAGRSVVLGHPFFAVAIVRNRTTDVGLVATVTVSAADGVPLATKQLKVGPRRRFVLQLPVTLTQLGTTQLTVTVTPATPIETTLKNNTRGFAVETVEFRVQESATLVQSFAGYGAEVAVIETAERDDEGRPTLIRLTTDPHAPLYGQVDPDRSHPYRQKEVIREVNARLDGAVVNAFDVLSVRRVHSITEETRPEFVHVPKFGSPQYSDAFVDWLVSEYERDPGFFERAKRSYLATRKRR